MPTWRRCQIFGLVATNSLAAQCCPSSNRCGSVLFFFKFQSGAPGLRAAACSACSVLFWPVLLFACSACSAACSACSGACSGLAWVSVLPVLPPLWWRAMGGNVGRVCECQKCCERSVRESGNLIRPSTPLCMNPLNPASCASV